MKRVKILIALIAVSLAGVLMVRASGSNVGQALPALKLTYLKEAPALAGKPLLLEFWATWCPPCRTSIPHLNELHAKYQAKGLAMVGVTNEKRDVVEAFLTKIPIHYSVGFDDGALIRGFGISGIPHAMLVNKQGKIVWEGHPMELKEKDIEAILK